MKNKLKYVISSIGAYLLFAISVTYAQSSTDYYNANPVTPATKNANLNKQKKADAFLQKFGLQRLPPSQRTTEALLNDYVRIKNASVRTKKESLMGRTAPPLTVDETKTRVERFLFASEYVPPSGNKTRIQRQSEVMSELNPPVLEKHKEFIKEESSNTKNSLNIVDPSKIKYQKTFVPSTSTTTNKSTKQTESTTTSNEQDQYKANTQKTDSINYGY